MKKKGWVNKDVKPMDKNEKSYKDNTKRIVV